MEKKIGKNVSSGAEKVETLEKETAKKSATGGQKTKKSAAAKSAAPGRDRVAEQMERARAEENAAAEARFEAAKVRAAKKEAARMQRANKKQAQMQAKLKAKEKRMEKLAEERSERAARHARKAARREMIAAESAAEKKQRLAREKRERTARKKQQEAERAAAIQAREEERRAAQEKRAAAREKKKTARAEKRSGKKRAPGIGGWIAAVVSLGPARPPLATGGTAGSLPMDQVAGPSEKRHPATLFELVSVSEEMDDNLAKLRVSAGAGEQRMLLTEILVDSELMESALEKIPVDSATSTDISSFVNRTNAFARRMLAKLSRGEQLTQEERSAAARLYEVNAALVRELNDLAVNTPAGELRAFFEGKTEIRSRFAEWGKEANKKPQEITDAPFAGEGNVGENGVDKENEVSVAGAEERVRAFFEGYHVADVKLTGETAARDMQCYNFTVTDENGLEIFAQVTKKGGDVAFFNSYEACTVKNFDLAGCDAIAREFLAARGYEDLTATWFSDTGMVACITYVSETDGVRCYPDMVQVRVCEEKGRVVGMDARGYLLNHENGGRVFEAPLSEGAARGKLAEGLEVTASHLAIVPVGRRETLCYEFSCKYGEEEYIIYLDARTGEEVRIFRVHESARGNYLS